MYLKIERKRMSFYENTGSSSSKTSGNEESFRNLEVVFKESNALKSITHNANSNTTYLYMGGVSLSFRDLSHGGEKFQEIFPELEIFPIKIPNSGNISRVRAP